MLKYQNYNHCPQCRGRNEVEIKDTVNLYVAECKTTCTQCGFSDYWAHGFFESVCEDENQTSEAKPEKELK